jgi:hypothetical protein
VDLKEETGYESVDWIHLARHRGQLQALVNTAINFPVNDVVLGCDAV